MFRLYWPWFLLLLPLPFFLRFFFPKKTEQKGDKIVLHFPGIERLKTAFPVYQTKKTPSKRKNYLLYLLWALLIFALARPENVEKFTQANTKGYDLLLAVDISPSMQALDLSTSGKAQTRLDVTKDVVGKFALERKGDRVGLIAFGQSAYLPIPLTLDTVSVSEMLNDISSGMAGNATAIGDAIALSVRTLRDRPQGSRVLVLLTDGEDNASRIPPKEAAKLAKQYGIRIYTIGVGKNGPVPFPVQYGGYRMVEMSIDEDLLKEVAKVTGGLYFHASDKEALEKIYDKINRLEKTDSQDREFLIREPLYLYPLAFAALLMVLLLLIPLYRRIRYGS